MSSTNQKVVCNKCGLSISINRLNRHTGRCGEGKGRGRQI